jgi:hypothetical protein
MAGRTGSWVCAGLAVACLGSLLAGCSGASQQADTEPKPTASPTPTTPAPTPTTPSAGVSSASPTHSASSTLSPSGVPTRPSTSSPAPVAGGLRAQLLTATELPGFNDRFRWRVESTYRGDGQDSAASCAHAGFESIGGTHIVRRDYSGPGGARAGEVLARFADVQSAERAYAVWKAWAEGCRSWLVEQGRRGARVGSPTPMHPARSEAFWWLASYGPVPDDPAASYFEATGVLQLRKTIALVVNLSSGQDYNDQPGEAPVARALRAAGGKLG